MRKLESEPRGLEGEEDDIAGFLERIMRFGDCRVKRLLARGLSRITSRKLVTESLHFS